MKPAEQGNIFRDMQASLWTQLFDEPVPLLLTKFLFVIITLLCIAYEGLFLYL
jgi:hypothetical protein